MEILPSVSNIKFVLSDKTEVAKKSLFSSKGFKVSIELDKELSSEGFKVSKIINYTSSKITDLNKETLDLISK